MSDQEHKPENESPADRGIPGLNIKKKGKGRTRTLIYLGLVGGIVVIVIFAMLFLKQLENIHLEQKAKDAAAPASGASGNASNDTTNKNFANDLPAPSSALGASAPAGETQPGMAAPGAGMPNEGGAAAAGGSAEGDHGAASTNPGTTGTAATDPQPATGQAIGMAGQNTAMGGTSNARASTNQRRIRQLDGEVLVTTDRGENRNSVADALKAVGLETGPGNTSTMPSLLQSRTNGAANGLDDKLTASALPSAVASRRQDLTHLLIHNTIIPCGLNQHLNTTHPGMISCTVTRDIWSANGRMVLVDRGSVISGEYRAALALGQAKIFVVWTTLDTPKGVTAQLNSPATDRLGGTGIDVAVDNHFGQRFGAAMLLSIIQDTAAYAAARNTNSGQITLSNTSSASQDLAAKALDNSINIPPTGSTNQGALVNVFVARDVDFRKVYALERQR